MKYTVKGDLKITYFVGVEMTVDASSEEEAMHKVAHAKKDDVDTEPEHYLYENGVARRLSGDQGGSVIEMKFQLGQVVRFGRRLEGRIIRRRLEQEEEGLYDVRHTEIYTVKVDGPVPEVYERQGVFLYSLPGKEPTYKEELALAWAIEERTILMSMPVTFNAMVKNICDAVAVGYDWRLVI